MLDDHGLGGHALLPSERAGFVPHLMQGSLGGVLGWTVTSQQLPCPGRESPSLWRTASRVCHTWEWNGKREGRLKELEETQVVSHF